MLDKVLGVIAFGRAPTRAVKVVLAMLTVGVAGLIAQSSVAAPIAAPEIRVAQTQDANSDGYLDGVLITFDSPMDASALPDGFTVSGYEIVAAEWRNVQGGTSTQLLLRLDPKTTADTGARPKVRYTRGGANKAKSPAGNELTTAEIDATDSAGPVLMQYIAKDVGPRSNLFRDDGDEMRLVFSEPVRVVGATPSDRVKALDLAIRFVNVGSCPLSEIAGNPNPVDANASNMASGKTNFPTVTTSATAIDPVVEPAANASSTMIRVRRGATHGDSTIQNTAVPGFCGAGIDPDGRTNITDVPVAGAAPNPAVGFNSATKRGATIAASDLLVVDGKPQIFSQDLAPGNGDGYVDAVKVRFDAKLVDASVTNDLAGFFNVRDATVTGVDTGTPGDDALVLRITPNQPWGGGVKPSVSFDGSTGALRTEVPTPGSTAPAGSFGLPNAIEGLDGVPPAVVSAKTLDTNGNGSIDKVEIVLTEKIAGGATIAGWKVDGQPITAIEAPAEATTIRLSITERPELGSAATPPVTYEPDEGDMTDLAGAELKRQTIPTADGVAPRVSKATALSTEAGKVTRVTLEFTESVVDASFDTSALEVGGAAVTGVSTSSIDTGTANDAKLTFATDLAGTAAHGVAYAGPLSDSFGNISTGFTVGAAEVVDAAKPSATIATTPEGTFTGGAVSVTVSFSEALDGNVAPAVKVGDKTVAPVTDPSHNAQGFRTADLSKWDGTVSFEAGDCAQQNGCALSVTATGGKDVTGNDALEATPAGLVLDSVAPEKATAGPATAVQQAGAPAIGENKIGGRTANIRMTAGIVGTQLASAGQTAGGSAELLMDGNAFDPAVKVSGIGSVTSVALETAFADAAALRTAIPEGTHTFAVKLCDSAGNCSVSDGVDAVADYTGVSVTLISPNTGEFSGGDGTCIQWDGDDTAAGFVSSEVRYSLTGDSAYPHVIRSGAPLDGALPCGSTLDGAGEGVAFTIPATNTSAFRIQVSTIDEFGNESRAASASDMSIRTITQTVLNFVASPASLVYGRDASVSGVLTGNGDGLGGKTVTIERRINGASAWQQIARVTTRNDGAFSYTVSKPHAIADYRAVFAATGPYLASQSVTRRITVAVNVTSVTNGSTFRRGQTMVIRGSVWPAKPGKEVWLQAYQSGKWVTVSKQKLNAQSYYQFGYRSTSARQLLFRVAYPTQGAEQAWNISQRYMITWR